nr:hypothetical protein [Alteromonas sp. PRIM-21]
MLAAATSGFVMGGTLIIAVGAQNSFLIEQSMKKTVDHAICLTVYSKRCHLY